MLNNRSPYQNNPSRWRYNRGRHSMFHHDKHFCLPDRAISPLLPPCCSGVLPNPQSNFVCQGQGKPCCTSGSPCTGFHKHVGLVVLIRAWVNENVLVLHGLAALKAWQPPPWSGPAFGRWSCPASWIFTLLAKNWTQACLQTGQWQADLYAGLPLGTGLPSGSLPEHSWQPALASELSSS